MEKEDKIFSDEGTDVEAGSADPDSTSSPAEVAAPEMLGDAGQASDLRAVSNAALNDVPNGGLQAWLQVVGSWVVLVDTWGLINVFGVYQDYYETTLLTTSSPSSISWIGSIQGFMLMFVGIFSGHLFDAGFFRSQLLIGLLLILLGQFLLSLATAYWQVLLSQGICVGIGMGLTFLPSTAILAQYFTGGRRALAIGLASTGSPIAGVVLPILFSRLQPTVGFGWATRIIAFLLLALSIIPVLTMRTRIPPKKGPGHTHRSIIDRTALRDPPYLVFICAGLFSFLTLYVPFFYIQVFATSHKIAAADGFAPYLVTLLNAGSIAGRVVPGVLAGRWGSALPVLVACTAGSSVLAFGWMSIVVTRSLGGLVVFALLYGAFSGGVVSLAPTVIVELSPDLGRVGARMGMSFLVSGTSILVGTPIAGALLGGFEERNWLGTIAYGAVGLLVAASLNGTAWFLFWGRKRREEKGL